MFGAHVIVPPPFLFTAPPPKNTPKENAPAPSSASVFALMFTLLLKMNPPLAALKVEAAVPMVMALSKVCVCVSLFTMPPVPTVSVVPAKTNAPAVLLKVTLFVEKTALKLGASRTVPAKMRSVFATSLSGAVLSSQLRLVVRLLSAPPPSQVSVTAKTRVARRIAMVVVRMRGVFM